MSPQRLIPAAIQRLGRAGSTSALLSLLVASSAPLRAGEVPFPPAATFRDLQLQTITCARDNRRDSCDSARRNADPLLDNPRLSSRCKDTLWSIRQTAVTAESNTPERRDRLDGIARDLTSFCRQSTPVPTTAEAGSGSTRSSGLRLLPSSP